MPAEAPTRRLVRILGVLAAILTIATSAAAGAWLALRADGVHVHRTAIGELSVTVRPALDGRLEVYVPVVDWQLRANAFLAPVAIVVEARSLDRDAAERALADPASAPDVVERMRRDAEHALEAAIRRAAFIALAGILGGGLLGGAVVAAVSRHRRWLAVGALQAIVLAACVIGPSVSNVRDLNVDDLADTRLAGNARELPRVIAFAQQLQVLGDRYEVHYERALRSVSNSLAFAGSGSGGGDDDRDVTLVVASDLHNNLFVLDAFSHFAGGDATVFAGDFGQVGARLETEMAPRIAASSDDVYAVSGNHDSDELMRSLADEGVTVLTRDDPIIDVAGLRVAGYDDPLEGRAGERHLLRVRGAAYRRQADDFLAWFDALPETPDVVVVHQHGFAMRLLDHLVETGVKQQVVIITGHDHVAHVDMRGPHVVVDTGTLGAGGPFAVGEQDASFGRIRFRTGDAYAVEIAAIEPLTGRAVARRIIIDRGHATTKTMHVSTRPDR